MRIRLSYIFIFVLLILLVVSNLWHGNNIKTKVVATTDTLIINTVDTIRIEKPILVQTIIRDTIVAKNTVGDSLKLIYSSKVYRDSLYQAYISGYNASLDSINIYNKTVYKTITNTIDRTVYKERWNLYLDCGIGNINSYITPNIGLSLSMPNGFRLGGEMGLYDSKVYYGFKIGYRIK